jgi:hypothetical protein
MSNPFVLLPFIEEAGTIDWRQYTPVDIFTTHGTVVSGNWKTVADLTGEGFIDFVLMQTNSGVNNQLRITVDGVLKYRMGATTSACPAVVLDDVLLPTTTGVAVPGTGTNGRSYTQLNGIRTTGDSYINSSETADDQRYVVRPFPIAFKSSFKVEVRIDFTGTIGSSLATVIQGGIK